MRFEVITAVDLKMQMFWIVILCTLVEMESDFHHITCH